MLAANTRPNNSTLLLDRMANVQKPTMIGSTSNTTLTSAADKYNPLLERMKKIRPPSSSAAPPADLFSSKRLVQNMVKQASKMNLTDEIEAAAQRKDTANDTYWNEDK